MVDSCFTALCSELRDLKIDYSRSDGDRMVVFPLQFGNFTTDVMVTVTSVFSEPVLIAEATCADWKLDAARVNELNLNQVVCCWGQGLTGEIILRAKRMNPTQFAMKSLVPSMLLACRDLTVITPLPTTTTSERRVSSLSFQADHQSCPAVWASLCDKWRIVIVNGSGHHERCAREN